MFQNNGSFKITIVVTGQPVSLGSIFPGGSKPVNRADIQGVCSGTNIVFVGAGNVLATNGNGGISLANGDVYNLELVTDLISVYVNGQAGDGITVNWWIGDRN